MSRVTMNDIASSHTHPKGAVLSKKSLLIDRRNFSELARSCRDVRPIVSHKNDHDRAIGPTEPCSKTSD
jgi:hypothetical protein